MFCTPMFVYVDVTFSLFYTHRYLSYITNWNHKVANISNFRGILRGLDKVISFFYSRLFFILQNTCTPVGWLHALKMRKGAHNYFICRNCRAVSCVGLVYKNNVAPHHPILFSVTCHYQLVDPLSI
jgi:hypothetical protein